MRTGTIFKRYEQFVAAATIAAHANASADGFRQRDVRFLIELFSNWVETTFEGQVLNLSNTQVLRYLDELVSEGFARRTHRQKRPSYFLTRTGLIELLGRLVPESLHIQAEHFFFLYYFLTNYRPRIERLVEAEGKQFPLSLRLELENLLDADSLARGQLAFAKLELKKLEARIKDAEAGRQLAAKLLSDEKELSEIALEVERSYPYELNSQKPLSELLSEIPDDLAVWEITEGSKMRVAHIWQPSLLLLSRYIECLESLIK